MAHPHKKKHEDIFENRREFQLERMILFSDAVFAIAITLLVLDLRLPEYHEAVPEPAMSSAQVIDVIGQMGRPLMGFIFSFCIIGQYWLTHHRVFSFVTGYDQGLMRLNLLTMFWIVLVPFSTSLNFRYNNEFTWCWYSGNLALVSFSIYLIWKHISDPRRNLTFLLDEPIRLRYGVIRSLVVTGVFLLGFLALLGPTVLIWCRYVFILIMPAMLIIKRNYERALARQGSRSMVNS